MIVSFHPLAEQELNDAAQYYELESTGLGAAFLTEIERCCGWILDHPEAGQVILGSTSTRVALSVRRSLHDASWRRASAGGDEPETATGLLGRALLVGRLCAMRFGGAASA